MIPDKDQVRAAIEYHAPPKDWTTSGTHIDVLLAVARAFVDGELLPAEPDYEAACWALIEVRRRAGYDVSAITELGLTLGDVILIVDAALRLDSKEGA